jgi:hypothetical protein
MRRLEAHKRVLIAGLVVILTALRHSLNNRGRRPRPPFANQVSASDVTALIAKGRMRRA